MTKLDIDPANIDLLMISHQHWDHTGGIYSILNVKRSLRVCVFHSVSAHLKFDMKRYSAEVIEVNGAQEIIPGFYTTAELGGATQEQTSLVMGRFHLLDHRDNEFMEIIAQFKTLGVRSAAASHCSGERARKLFAREYKNHFLCLGAGSFVEIDQIRGILWKKPGRTYLTDFITASIW